MLALNPLLTESLIFKPGLTLSPSLPDNALHCKLESCIGVHLCSVIRGGLLACVLVSFKSKLSVLKL
ncbi:hypothetical protein FKM82_011397 [Ascaphus truei]